jgi:hypothetical protein
MRILSRVLALSTVLASFILVAAQHPANAGCGIDRLPGCDGPGRLGPRDHDLPPDLWDRVKTMQLSPAGLDDLIKRMEDIAHKIADAEGRAVDLGKKIADIDDQIDKLKSDRITTEAEKHAAEEERDRQQLRLVGLLHDIRPPPLPCGEGPCRPDGCRDRPCRPDGCRDRPCRPDGCRDRPCSDDWRARRWFRPRPRPVFHHFCPPLYPPPFPPPWHEPPPVVEYPPPIEFFPPPLRVGGVHVPGPPCCGCWRNRDP